VIAMSRTIAALIAAVLMTVAAAAAAATDIIDATMKHGIVVDRPTILLSDVLEGADAREDVVIARAPMPGDKVALNPLAVARIAGRHRIRWMPPANLHRIMVRRASQIVDAGQVLTEIELALMDAAPQADLEIELAGRRPTLHVATDADPSVQVESMDYDRRTGRFTAIVAAPADDPSAQRHKIHGRAWPMTEVPVLSRAIRPGDEIMPQDVGWQRVREDRVRRQNVVDIAELVGMSPKRSIPANRMVRVSDLRRPVMVAKGDIVTMIFLTNGLTLTASGRAIEDGGRNAVVRVMNERSRMIVEGRVTAPGRVSVGEAAHRLSQLQD
jgi:flagella basal body P-ring formation protein FlgA